MYYSSNWLKILTNVIISKLFSISTILSVGDKMNSLFIVVTRIPVSVWKIFAGRQHFLINWKEESTSLRRQFSILVHGSPL